MAMVLTVAATVVFSACSKDGAKEVQPAYDTSLAPRRTVMVYMVAENSMYADVNTDLQEMLQGVSTTLLYPDDRLVVYVDDMGLPRVYVLDRSTQVAAVTDLQPVPYVDTDVNSASAEQLGAFVKFVKETYQADSYGLVMWSHGSGWIPSDYSGDQVESAQRRSFGVDNGRNSKNTYYINLGHQMNIPEMAQALEEQGGVDFILFDACSMQTIEVVYELRGATDYVVASPAEIPGPGADYTTMVPALFQKDDCAQKVMKAYYDKYCDKPQWGSVMSCVSTSGLEAFSAYMKQVVAQHREDLLQADYSPERVQSYLHYDEGNWGTDLPDGFDMQGVMKQVLSEEEFEVWKEKAAQVVTCMQSGFWYSSKRGGYKTYSIDASQCCGVTMFVPLEKYEGNSRRFNETYLEMEWGRKVWEGEE